MDFSQQKEIQRQQQTIEDLEDIITKIRRVSTAYIHLIHYVVSSLDYWYTNHIDSDLSFHKSALH